MMRVELNYDNLPAEWKERDQWVCYDITEDGKKIPYTPGTASKARSNDATTWRSYEDALTDVETGERHHLGYMLTRENGEIFLDLDGTDDPEEKGINKLIAQTFVSYTEYSISGKGLHIIAKGKLEGRGLHTSHFGLFEHARGILVTGHIYQGRNKITRANPKALRSLQDRVRKSDGRGYDFDLEESEWDMQPWAMLKLAHRIYGVKFLDLYDGRWQKHGYPSQSEADHALVNMFCDISDSNPLCRFSFAESGLYREHKARMDPATGEYSVKGYLDYSIKYNRAKAAERAESKERNREEVQRQVKSQTKAKKAAKKKAAPKGGQRFSIEGFPYPTERIDRVPSKLLRMLARHLYRNSYLPNQDVAILGALVYVTMVVQRAYFTPSGTGCNLNFWLIVDTGVGKDAFIKAIDRIVSDLRKEQPALGNSHTGKFASGEAIETVISEQPRFMSRVSEAGAFWRKLLNPHRPPYIDVLVESILNLFMATEPDAFWKCRKKAKKDEDVAESVFRPAGSFYGESTPEDLLGDLDLHSVSTGLLQRQLFFPIEDAPFVEENESRAPMSDKLKGMLNELVSTADNLDLMNDTITVEAEEEAGKILRAHSKKHRRYAHDNKGSLRSKMMNRSGIKAFRVASLLAIAENCVDPSVTEKMARYAVEFVRYCDEYILEKFTSGDIGRGQLKQDSDMMKLVHFIIAQPEEKRRKTYRMNEFCAADETIIPYSWLRNRAKGRASFQGDKLGAITAIDRCIDSLCKSGTLVRLTRQECEAEYETSAGLLRYTAQ